MDVTVYCADWLLPVSSAPIKDGAVAVVGDRIVAAGNRAEVIGKVADCQLVELGRAALMPGLVNVHTHLELTLMRGYLERLSFRDWIVTLVAAKSLLTPDHFRASAIWGACEAARAGITTLADTGATGAALDGMAALGLRGIVYQEVFGPDAAQVERSMDELKSALDRLTARAHPLITIGVSPHAVYTVSAPLFDAVARFAISAGLPMAIHAAEAKAEESFLREGRGPFADGLRQRGIEVTAQHCSVIEYLAANGALEPRPLLIHCVRLYPHDFDLISQSGSSIAHCPKSNAKFGHGRAPLRAMSGAGINVGLGSDSVASNNICDLLDEARFCALLHRASEGHGFEADELIRMATLGGAEALGWQDRIGTLEAGKQADLIAVDLEKLNILPVHNIEAAILFCASNHDVKLTVVAGREIYRDGLCLTVDEAGARAELAKAATHLVIK